MATPDVLASTIMDKSASLLNDVNKQVYTFAVQIPYLQMAFQELREMFEESNIPVTQFTTTPAITVPISTTEIGFATIPSLPSNLVEIQQLWQRPTGVDPYYPMTRADYLPHYLEGAPTQQYLVWAWMGNAIHLLPTTEVNDLKIDYIAELQNVIDENSNIGVINGQPFLEFRTAALCAEFVGANITRANSLNVNAILSRDRAINVENKAKQATTTRRRPFRNNYKRRGPW